MPHQVCVAVDRTLDEGDAEFVRAIQGGVGRLTHKQNQITVLWEGRLPGFPARQP